MFSWPRDSAPGVDVALVVEDCALAAGSIRFTTFGAWRRAIPGRLFWEICVRIGPGVAAESSSINSSSVSSRGSLGGVAFWGNIGGEKMPAAGAVTLFTVAGRLIAGVVTLVASGWSVTSRRGGTASHSVTVSPLPLSAGGGGCGAAVVSDELVVGGTNTNEAREPDCGVLYFGFGSRSLSQSGDTGFLEYWFGGVGGFFDSRCLIASILSSAAFVLFLCSSRLYLVKSVAY